MNKNNTEEIKRLELYLGWKCNNKCIFCTEYPVMENFWNKKISIFYILKKLIKYKKKGYNHVTFLGGEPFIQHNFLDALKIAKKLGYKILVATNATTLDIEREASKYLPYIDELILSIHGIKPVLQKTITQNKRNIDYNKVFKNIDKYWNGTLLKVNIVINKKNIGDLLGIIKEIISFGVKEIGLNYPELEIDYYGENSILNDIAPQYDEVKIILKDIILLCDINSVNFKIANIPFCYLGSEEYVKYTDEMVYTNRLKIDVDEEDLDSTSIIKDRDIDLPRKNIYSINCGKCKYNKICLGIGEDYNIVYPNLKIQPYI